jgi:uncharacterized protein YbcC (UPF0753/DUF2309 family)
MDKDIDKKFLSGKDPVAVLNGNGHWIAADAKDEHVGEMKIQFDEKHALHELHHYLPSQTSLKDFIHHNSLHAFQNMKFYDALFKASKIFGYQVTLQLSEYRQLYENGRIRKDILDRVLIKRKGDTDVEVWKERLLSKSYNTENSSRIGMLRRNWKELYRIDLDNLVQPLLFRTVCSFLDQGISVWNFPSGNQGFLQSMRELEKNSYSSFFKTRRARNLLLETDCSLRNLLKLVVGNESLYEHYLFDQQFSHQGWSGIVSSIELQPESLLETKNITLRDFIAFELLLEIDALEYHFGNNWDPLAV